MAKKRNSTMRLNKLLHCLLCLCITSTLFANEKRHVDINFKNLDIDSLVKLTSKILNKNIMISGTIGGTVDFVSTKPIYEDELLDIVQSILASKGFTIVENPTFLEVVKLTDASKYNLPVAKAPTHYKQMITQSIKIKNDDANAIANKIKHLISKAGQVIPSTENNLLVITDFPSNIKTVAEVIAMMDQHQEKEVAFIKLKNIKVQKAYTDLSKVVQDAHNSKLPEEKVSIIQNVDANMIVLVGRKQNVSKMSSIVEKFDTLDEKTKQELKIITLKNSEAKNTFKTIQFVVKSKQYATKEETPVVSVDEDTNSIVILGPKESIQELEAMIVELDKEKQQVYVQAQIIEVNENLTNEIGAKYGLTAGSSTSSGLFGFSSNLVGQSSFDILKTMQSLNTQTGGSDFSGEIKNAIVLNATIDFLKKNTAINIVSEPSILCINNKESSIYVGETRSIKMGTQTTDGGVTSDKYTREDIGLTLKIKPLISNDKKVTLDITTTLEDVSTTQTTNGNPDTSKKQIKTVALVRDGENVIIGGLIKDKIDNTESKVPLLGDIPLLGYAFRHNSDAINKINLVVILTPYVVEASSDMTALRERLAKLDLIKAEVADKLRLTLEEKSKHANP